MSRTKIVRRQDFAGGGITPDETARMDECAKFWIANAMRTDTVDPPRLEAAIHRLYEVSGLKCPRVVIVPSPLVMAFAGGAAAWIWHCRKNGRSATDRATVSATYGATYGATDSATLGATRRATASATLGATRRATASATLGATYSATASATRSATYAATYAATYDATCGATADATYSAIASATLGATRRATTSATLGATYSATASATDSVETGAALACAEFAARGGLECAKRWTGPYQGGNMWSGWCSFLSAARDILGLRLEPHPRYAVWEEAALTGGFRWMHEEFCIVSDFPERLLVDAQNRPHCDTGPSHRWRDGWSLYHVHGVRVPGDIIEHPDSITPSRIESESNAEVRRVMIERYGQQRYLLDSGAEQIATDHVGTLYRKTIRNDEPLVMVKVRNSTPEPDGSVRDYFIRVPPDVQTPQEAVAWTFGLDRKEYAPTIET